MMPVTVLAVLLILFGQSSAYNALSSLSTLRNQCADNRQRQPQRTASVRVHLAAFNGARSNVPGSELFPAKGSSYVPMGLTEEQYKKIKEEENKKNAKMNFGAWGPRFQQSDAPDGDWMVMPSLWTQGFSSNRKSDSVAANKSGVASNGPAEVGDRNNWRNIFDIVRRHGPAFLVSYLLIDMILVGIAVARAAKLSSEPIFALALRMMVWKKKMFLLAMWKMKVLEFTSSLFLVRPIEALIERTNRRRLWSPRRTMGALIMGMVVLLSSWSAMVMLFR